MNYTRFVVRVHHDMDEENIGWFVDDAVRVLGEQLEANTEGPFKVTLGDITIKERA